ncbi:MAG: D-tagatose-bisphosphate aldolase, class II, non-catalytic subunit [Steroidobacteraceae bacterium]
MKALLDIIGRHKQGQPVGVYSLCSAHPLVIEAAMHEAKAASAPLLVEATCNQVNQFGGYTGLKPGDFRGRVEEIAARAEFPRDRLWLGGDHLGPNPWQKDVAAVALGRAEEMVEGYVAAGFRKIHLDCSMTCADDPVPLPEAVVATRAARLGAIAERAWRQHGGEPPVYVIGTEVPTPGGAAEDLAELAVTTPQSAESTIAAHRKAFADAGLSATWPRVIALVVQPGVEFDHHKVVDYAPAKARPLSDFIARDAQFVFEAHSTDYQTPAQLEALVRDHFAILKVGPAATFALRECLWALEAIERELPDLAHRSRLREVVLGVMRANPGHWRDYYGAGATLDLEYSLSDRIRYYWPHPDVQQACETLLGNLRTTPVPLTLLSQYLPRQYEAVRDGRLAGSVDALLRDGIATALRPYLRACRS